MLTKIVRRSSEPSSNPPVLVLLHGVGANEHDLMGLAPSLDPRLTVVCYRAPHDYGLAGYAWFDVQWHADGFDVNEEQALESREILLQEFDSLPSELGFQPSKFFLGGFSQGSIMSLGISVKRPQGLDGVLLLSGRVLPDFVQADPPEEFSKLPFLVQHGIVDQVLTVQQGRAIKAYLESRGCPMTYREYPMGHEISFDSLSDIKKWLADKID